MRSETFPGLRRRLGPIAAIGLVWALPQTALADVETIEERQMTLPAGQLFLQTFVEMQLSADVAFEPVSIAPDLWYGVTDELSVGLVHSGRGATGFLGGVGSGLCITGTSGGCAKFYNNVGVDARYHFFRNDEGDLTFSAAGGLYMGPFDPFTLALKAGVVGRWHSGAIAVDVAPSLFAGLTQRSLDGGGGIEVRSNQETLFLPITGLYSLMPELALAAQLGAILPLQDVGDAWLLSFSLGAQYLVTERILADLSFTFPSIVGAEAVSAGIDARSLLLGVGYAF
jgi:hypothetical protein